MAEKTDFEEVELSRISQVTIQHDKEEFVEPPSPTLTPEDVISPPPKNTGPPTKYSGTRRDAFLLFIGLTLASFLASLDGTIVSTALPRIATELNGVEQLPWVATAYLLTYNACQPLYGKFSDIFGRKAMILFAVIVFIAASVGCGASTSMVMLIVFRAIAGIGAAGIMGMVLIVISDIFSLEERPKYQAIIWAVFGVSSVIGPLMGGAFADKATWRWTFYINGPIGVVSAIAVFVFLRLPFTMGSVKDKMKRIDFLGAVFLIIAVVLLLLPLNWGGSKYAWNSGPIIGLFVAFAVMVGVFIFTEFKLAAEPVIPPHIFKNITVSAAFACNFFVGMGFFGLIFYTPIFFQVVKGDDATTSGIQLIPMLLGLVVFSIFAGATINRIGNYQIYLIFGTALFTVGAGLVSTFDENISLGKSIGYLLIVGAGLGFTLQMVLLSAQAAVAHEDMAVVTALVGFFQSIGGGIGIAIYASLLSNLLPKELAKIPAGIITPEVLQIVQSDISNIHQLLPPNVIAYVVQAYVAALQQVYRVGIPFGGIAFLFSFLIRTRRLVDVKETMEYAA